MSSIKKLLLSYIFKWFVIIFVSMIFILNLSFYLFTTIQYRNEINRQYDGLKNMTSHLAHEEDIETLNAYLEHYTHVNRVIITFENLDHEVLFSNDIKNELTNQEDVYYENQIVGYLSASFETSKLGKELTSGFIIINLTSILIGFSSVLFLYLYLKKENNQLIEDMSFIQDEHASIKYKEIHQLRKKIVQNQKDKEKQKAVYEAHIKKLAHDIKTPLTVIKLYVEALENRKIEYSDFLINDIKVELEKLEQHIPKFIESDENEVAYEQDISIFTETYIQKYLDVFESKNIKIIKSLDSLVLKISDGSIKRLLEHLLFNAFYYAYPISELKIEINAIDHTLIIEDQGIGMSNHDIDSIYKGPYRSEKAIKMHPHGSGIGYQIVFDIIKEIGANLQIQSKLNVGTKVIIQFKTNNE